MYIMKNAWISIARAKGRNILILIVALVIAVAACIALSIREAAETAREETLSQLSVTATISFDRSAAMSAMMGAPGESSSTESRPDFSSLEVDALSLDDYLSYTQAQSDGDSHYYTLTASLNASGDLSPYSSSDGEETDTSDTADTAGDAQGGGFMQNMPGGGSFTAQGDFSITGFASYDAMMSLFGADGTCSITDGEMFSEDTKDYVCVISDELAMLNDLAVGDVITLCNPNYDDETYALTIVGIYTNTESSAGSSMFSMTDPANNIYMSYSTLKAIAAESSALGYTYEDDDGNEMDAALQSELAFTYVFADVENYYTFEEGVYSLGLSDEYTVTSSDLSAFEQSMTPLETLSTMAGWFFFIVLVIGGVILVVLNIFNIRERKYEVGVLTARGMKKGKVSMQFICELFTVTFVAIVLGTVIGACISVPIANGLLSSQIESTESSSQNISQNFGFASSEDMAATMGTDSGGRFGGTGSFAQRLGAASYIDSVSSATDLTVILELVGVGLFLTLVSSMVAIVTITRYEPLKILTNRS